MHYMGLFPSPHSKTVPPCDSLEERGLPRPVLTYKKAHIPSKLYFSGHSEQIEAEGIAVRARKIPVMDF